MSDPLRRQAGSEATSKEDLVVWLTEQIDVDARDADDWHTRDCAVGYYRGFNDGCDCDGPGRVLRQVSAYRLILRDYESARLQVELAEGTVLAGATRLALRLRGEAARAVAMVYSDRPGFDPSWTVE